MKKTNSISLEPEQIKLLQSKLSKYDKNLFNLMLNTGLRSSEIVDLVNQIYKSFDTGLQSSYEIKCKGNVKRVIDIPLHMFEWYKFNQKKMFGAINNRKALERRVNRWGLLVDRNLTPHDLRATAITMLNWVGVDIVDISNWIAHKNIETTAKYIKRSPMRRKQISKTLWNINYNKQETFEVDLKVQNEYLKQENKLLQQEVKSLKDQRDLLIIQYREANGDK